MNLLNRILYSKLYSEESGGEAAAGGGGEVLDGGADGNGGEVNNATADAGGTIDGGANGDGVELFAGKYKTVDELVKGYTESVAMSTKSAESMNSMSEKLKGFAGAPEGDYELGKDTVAFNESVMSELGTWGKEQGLSQDAYSDLISKVQAADAAHVEKFNAEQMEILGKDAQVRIDNTNDKLEVIFGSEMAEIFKDVGTSAEGVEALEYLVSRFGENKSNPDGGDFTGEEAITQDELGELMNKKDSAGTPMMQASPAYAKKVYAKIEQYNKQHGIS